MKRRKNTTIREVAQLAKVSLMTVSNVMNGRFENMTSETRARVEGAIRRLGYRPSRVGRSLRLSQRFSTAFIVMDESPTYLADPFTTYLVAGLSNHLSHSAHGLVMHGVTPAHFERSFLLRATGVDAYCVLLSGPLAQRKRHMKLLDELVEPVIFFQETAPPQSFDLCTIRQDDYSGAAALAEMVTRAGASNAIILVPALNWPGIEARQKAIADVFSRAQNRCPPTLLCGAGTFADVQASLETYWQDGGRPDAVFGANDQIGIAAQRFFQRKGLKVPADIAVTGFNAFELRHYSAPLLTSVRSPAYEMGRRAGEEILYRLAHGKFRTNEVVLPTAVEVGESTRRVPQAAAAPATI